MEKFLREWRQEAANRNQYESAIFVGDKVLALTNSDADAVQLAKLFFQTGNYTRAQKLLSRGQLISHNPECKYLAAHCLIKEGRFDEAIGILGEKNPQHLIETSKSSRRKLARVDANGPSATSRQGVSRGKREVSEHLSEKDAQDATNTRFQAAMCYLRGICYAKQNAFDRAKECYKDAVRIDVQCFEAFDQLMKNALMSPDEEWSFLESLNFDTISAGDNSASQQAAELTKMLYITRLSKYKNPREFNDAVETLSTHYRLSSNPDLLLSKAELFFTQCRFKAALALTELILTEDKYSFTSLPVHLACLHELSQVNALFLLSHDFADKHPEEPATWLAVGVYYLATGKIAESRRYFSKASMMDPHFGPAWIGFAHTFAAEGEHDQAISAYSTAARLFQGTHLPQLFLGMQNIQLNNMPLAHEYLNTAYTLCQTDPLLLNELGVVFYHEDHMQDAINVFTSALTISFEIDADPRASLPTRANLGHAYRRAGRLAEALAEFNEVLRTGGPEAHIFTAKGLVLLETGDPWAATTVLHEALAMQPQDPVANDLLGKALEESAALGFGDGEDGEDGVFADDEVEALVDARKAGVLSAGSFSSSGTGGGATAASKRDASGRERRAAWQGSGYGRARAHGQDVDDENTMDDE